MCGIIIMINESPARSKYQQSVALSTTEAEYVALSLCVREIIYLKNLLTEMKVMVRYPMKMNEYN